MHEGKEATGARPTLQSTVKEFVSKEGSLFFFGNFEYLGIFGDRGRPWPPPPKFLTPLHITKIAISRKSKVLFNLIKVTLSLSVCHISYIELYVCLSWYLH